jgi:hypothetical protein
VYSSRTEDHRASSILHIGWIVDGRLHLLQPRSRASGPPPARSSRQLAGASPPAALAMEQRAAEHTSSRTASKTTRCAARRDSGCYTGRWLVHCAAMSTSRLVVRDLLVEWGHSSVRRRRPHGELRRVDARTRRVAEAGWLSAWDLTPGVWGGGCVECLLARSLGKCSYRWSQDASAAASQPAENREKTARTSRRTDERTTERERETGGCDPPDTRLPPRTSLAAFHARDERRTEEQRRGCRGSRLVLLVSSSTSRQ